jgi:hypothetical protein
MPSAQLAMVTPAGVGAAIVVLCLSCHRGAPPFDPASDTRVAVPAYHRDRPRVLFDEAHRNYHTARGRYKPFVDLLTSDGHRVARNRAPFSPASLKGFDVLVIASAQGPDPTRDDAAFTDAECDAVRDWVRAGGGLLLITDHYPFAGAAAVLARRFGVGITRGITEDPVHRDRGSAYFLVFTRESGLVAEHPVTAGRHEGERISRVMTFGGSSLEPPPDAVPLLRLSPRARERPAVAASPRGPGQSAVVSYGDPAPARGSAQAIALEFGLGRVVVLGEAGMLTAQVRGASAEPFGMNVKGIDNRQLALNIMRWLSRLLDPSAGPPASSGTTGGRASSRGDGSAAP